MLFFSDIFLFVFLPLVLLAFYACRRRSNATGQKFILLLASVFFYGFWSWRHVPLLLAAAAIALIAIRLIEHRARGGASPGYFPLLLGVIGSLGLLMVFKYAGFWADAFYGLTGIRFFNEVSPRLHSIVLPLGISFYTLQGTAAVVDRWRAAREGKINAQTPALDFFTFMTFFPQLVAGPIVRAGELMPQLDALPGQIDPARAARGLTIFAVGLAKKVLLADYCAPIVNALFNSHATPTAVDAAIGSLAYTCQLYFDFAGYSDMAIGLAALFGFELPINFLSPYRSASFTEYWRKNHITLSFWFRDYLYIPLGGSRCSFTRRTLNIFAVMGVAGLWHGASWTFVVWGLYQAVFILLHRAWRRIRKKYNLPAPNRAVAVGQNFIFLTLGLVLFRATSFKRAMEIYMAFGNWRGGINLLAGVSSFNWALLAISTFVILFVPNIQHFNIRLSWRWALITGLLLAASIAGVTVYSPFIYFQF